MFFRFGSKSGKAVPSAGQALKDIHSQLQQQQQLWTETLAQDPSCFAALEQEVHLRFGQLADQFVARLLAGVANQPALRDAAKQKSLRPNGPFVRPSNAPAASACSVA
jgi:hypothetical protein